MDALSIKNPYAFDILTGAKPIEYRTWQPGNTTQFLLVSSQTPSTTDFGLGMANGYALAIVQITAVSPHPDQAGNYSWHVRPMMPITPFPVKGRLHFYEVNETQIQRRPALIPAMRAFLNNHTDPAGAAFKQQIIDPLTQIGITQMPQKYQRLFKATGSWRSVIQAWHQR